MCGSTRPLGEDAGLDKPTAKPRHYATPFDDRVLVFLMLRKAISTMRLGPVKLDKKPVLKEVCYIYQASTTHAQTRKHAQHKASVNFVPIVNWCWPWVRR